MRVRSRVFALARPVLRAGSVSDGLLPVVGGLWRRVTGASVVLADAQQEFKRAIEELRALIAAEIAKTG